MKETSKKPSNSQKVPIVAFIGVVIGCAFYYFNQQKPANEFPVFDLEPIVVQECKDPLRNKYEKCSCPDQYYDDGIHDECQICPYPCTNCQDGTEGACVVSDTRLFIALDHITNQESLDQIDDFLVNVADIYFDGFNHTTFKARQTRHSDSVKIKTGYNGLGKYDSKSKRRLKISDHYWKFHENAQKLQPLVKFIEDLDIFEYWGESTLIINHPNEDGIEHRDHTITDFLSEFIWIRFNRDKQFYVIDEFNLERHFVSSYIGFFDDIIVHSIATTPYWDYSLRVNGKFKPHIRKYIADHYGFDGDEERRQHFINQEFTLKPDYDESEGKLKLKPKNWFFF